jgi:hypothetical protein
MLGNLLKVHCFASGNQAAGLGDTRIPQAECLVNGPLDKRLAKMPYYIMPGLSGAEEALHVFAIYGEWFGPPPILDEERSRIIDGAKRTKAANELGIVVPPPFVVAGFRACIRALCAAQEYERAREYLSSYRDNHPETRKEMGKWLNIPELWFVRMSPPRQLRPGETRLRARTTVSRIRKLIELTREGGTVGEPELMWALGELVVTDGRRR